jgi:hypothetical protein
LIFFSTLIFFELKKSYVFFKAKTSESLKIGLAQLMAGLGIKFEGGLVLEKKKQKGSSKAEKDLKASTSSKTDKDLKASTSSKSKEKDIKTSTKDKN